VAIFSSRVSGEFGEFGLRGGFVGAGVEFSAEEFGVLRRIEARDRARLGRTARF
jgi:hypothetical protein